MKSLKYIYLILVAIITASILYFPYYLKYRHQFSLTNDEKKLHRLSQELMIYEIPGLNLQRLGRDGDGGYIIPEEALKTSDILLGYGIGVDNSFEEAFSLKYGKRSFGFDCGSKDISSKSNLFTLIPHCIGTDDKLFSNQKSSGKISSFSEQISFLHLEDKNLFIKMDIEGTEYNVFDDILRHSGQINGIVMELHIQKEQQLDDAIDLLDKINKDFLLLHIHGNNCSKAYISGANIQGEMPSILELTFINKRLVQDYRKYKFKSFPTKLDRPNCPIREENKFKISF